MHWFPLTLICALALAASDTAAKHWLQDVSARELTLIRLGLSGLLLAPMLIGQPLPELPMAFWGWMLLLVPLELLAMMLYMRAIRDYPLSETLPYMAFTPVFVILTGWLILDEVIPTKGIAGILLVVAGSWLLNMKEQQDHPLQPFTSILHSIAARMMLTAAAIYAITSAGGKAAMQWMQPAQFGPFYFVLVGSMAWLLIFSSKPASVLVLKRHPWSSLLVAGLMALMVFSHFFALSMVETAYMIAVKRSSLLFGVLFGILLFHEGHGTKHLLASGLMIGGVSLIALS